MRHDYAQEGEAFSLRPVGHEDSRFIVGLRTDPALGRFLNATSSAVADQDAWLERYFERDGDFYFIVVNRASGEREGAIALYDEDRAAGGAEWGRWILRPGSLAAAESALMIYRFGFGERGLKEMYCRTVADNEKVVGFHTASGLETVRPLPGYFNGRDSVEQRATPALWPGIEANLARHAAMSARLARRAAS